VINVVLSGIADIVIRFILRYVLELGLLRWSSSSVKFSANICTTNQPGCHILVLSTKGA